MFECVDGWVGVVGLKVLHNLRPRAQIGGCAIPGAMSSKIGSLVFRPARHGT